MGSSIFIYFFLAPIVSGWPQMSIAVHYEEYWLSQLSITLELGVMRHFSGQYKLVFVQYLLSDTLLYCLDRMS